MKFYALQFEHLPFSVFRDAERIAQYSPLRRAPTLVLDDGSVLTESFVCLEALDQRIAEERGANSESLLLPRAGSTRLDGLRLSAFATGTAEKAVSLAYERIVRESSSALWVERCTKQIRETLELLEYERAMRKTAYLLGDRISHADIALTCAFTFLLSAHPEFLAPSALPTLRAHTSKCEALAEFSSVFQPFDIPVE